MRLAAFTTIIANPSEVFRGDMSFIQTQSKYISDTVLAVSLGHADY